MLSESIMEQREESRLKKQISIALLAVVYVGVLAYLSNYIV
ncbi:hypothetical protein [Vibrio sp. HN007]